MTVTSTARRLALVGVAALTASLLPFASATAQDEDRLAFELSGDTAVDIAQTWSETAYPDAAVASNAGPTEVLLGRDDLFADNLASGSLQGGIEFGRPLLLTDGDALDQVVIDELERLGGETQITTVHILGGVAAVSQDVEDELDALGYGLNRFEGETRTETAIDIAEVAFADADTALLVRSGASAEDETQAFADALGAGAWAAEADVPVLFTQSDVLTGTTAAYLESSDIENVIIVGGNAAVSDDVEAEVAAIVTDVSRVAGENRFDTAVQVNEARELGGQAAVLVDGQVEDAWVNGFVAANISGNQGYPLVLSNNGALPAETETYLEDFYAAADAAAFQAHFGPVYLICGTNTGDACDDAAAIANATVVPFPPDEEPVADNTGIVIDVANVGGGAGDYEYQPEDGSAAVVQEYDEDTDTFSIDGAPATVTAWEGLITVGDQITVTETEDGFDHALVDQEPVEEGVIGFVDTDATTSFQIIEPVSGAVIGAGAVDYSADCDLYTVDGTSVTETIFENNLNIGDTYTFDEAGVAPNTVQTCNIENGTVAGPAGDVDVLAADSAEFVIGNLGDFYDDTVNAGDVFFVDGTNVDDQEFVVDGETADAEDFVEVLSDGDQVTYTRVNGIETFTLVNVAPGTIAGQAVDGLALDTFDIATNPGLETVEYNTGAAATRFIVDGFIATEADFEGDYTAGDMVSYTPEDTAGGTAETVSLTNMVLTGAVEDDGMPGDIDLGLTSYDVLSTSGDVVLDTIDYTAGNPTDRYFVDGAEVDQAGFEDGLTEIIDGDSTGEISYVDGTLADEHRLTLTDA